jgi:uncharacterized protein (DUF3084 family)
MNDVGIILILSVLLIGAIIANLGDRIGTRIGKKRLSLFNLRPKHTAVVVTIITGLIISATTLIILFASSKSLRTGVFKLDEIQEKLRSAQQDLDKTVQQKKQIEKEFNQVKDQAMMAQKRLDNTNKTLQSSLDKQLETEQKLQSTSASLNEVSKKSERLRADIDQLNEQRRKLILQEQKIKSQLDDLKEQIDEQKETINDKEKDLKNLDQKINLQDRLITSKNQTISQKEQDLSKVQNQLKTSQKKLDSLLQELSKTEQNFQDLRQGNLALSKGKLLYAQALRLTDPSQAKNVLDQLLSQANKNALQAIYNDPNASNNKIVVQIEKRQADQIIRQITDGQEYVIAIVSSGNYVQGDKQVEVFAFAVPNKIIFPQGANLAGININPSTMSATEIKTNVEKLLGLATLLGKRYGIINDQLYVGDGTTISLLNFITQLQNYSGDLDIIVKVSSDVKTVGPLTVNLVAVKEDKEIFSTDKKQEK